MDNEFGFNYPFKTFLHSRQDSEILESIHESPTLITPGLLFEITFWLSEVIGFNDDELNHFLTDNIGIKLIYQSTTKSEANTFMIFYYHYLGLIQDKEKLPQRFENGIITIGHAFVEFLDFFILFLKEIGKITELNKNNRYTEETQREIEKITVEKSKDVDFRNLLDSEIQKFHSLYKLSLRKLEQANHKYFYEVDLVNRNLELLYKSIIIKIKLNNGDDYVVIVDSI